MQRLQQYWNAVQERQVPLEFLTGPNVWKAGISRDSIINAVGNVRTTEALSRKAYRNGQQGVAQARNITVLHRAQVQRLAALANEHAHLCYEFEDSELFIHNLHWTVNPTVVRAFHGCTEELHRIEYTLLQLDPDRDFQPALAIIRKWYSLAFACTVSEFHKWIWEHYKA
jgi:hypothetical protein